MLTWEDIIEAEDTTDRREFGRMCSGITVFRQGRAMILLMPNAGFRTLSSGFTNGGFMESPQAVVNVSAMGGKVEYTCMKGGLGTYDRMNTAYAQKLGLDPQRTVFQGTAANMENAAIVNDVSADGVKVSMAVTGGIRHNGGRAGDPAHYDESESVYDEKPGTIIALMALDANLSDGAMFQAMLIATEAKSCVIQELQARSLYSEGIATGSGTDQVTVVTNTISSDRIESIPRDSELAKTIAQCMKQALRKTFALQTGMTPEAQWDPLVLMSRYSMDGIRDEIRFPATMDELLSALEVIRKDPYNTAVVSAVLNIADDVRNGLISELDGIELARTVCEDLALQPVTDPVERLRLDFAETIPDVLSYASALKLMEVVRERRSRMGSEIIQRNIDEISIFFPDSDHDVLTSTEIGLVEGVKYIHAGNGETSYRDGNLYIHIDGDPTRFSISELSYGSTFVTAIAFADLKGGFIRAGEETDAGQGEILLILLIDSNLPDSAMARAGITATEGITASLQDLGLAYSSMIPSGMVKQNILVIRDRGSRMYLRGAGKHTKLGELIGCSTIEAVKASAAENGITIVNRMSLLSMLEPYGYDQEKLFNLSGSQDMSLFLVKIIASDSKPAALASVSAALHIYHEVQWGLLDDEVGLKVVRKLMRTGLLQDVSGMPILDTIAAAVARHVAEN